MTPSIWLRDILYFGIQLALVIGAGAAAFHALRIRDARVSLAYWRTLLLVCLLLPVCQPWTTAPSPAPEMTLIQGSTERAQADYRSESDKINRAPAWPAASAEVVLLCLAGGVAARSLWLILGACRLRTLRRSASLLEPVPFPIRQAQARVGVRARIVMSDHLAGPITFGFFDPVVILPPWIHDVESHVQEAIAYHELIHVQRHDWLDEILEEAVRTLFWFHPAVRWLIGRVQLSREQVVDQRAIQLTDSRERYVDALLAVAVTRSPIALVPAPLFLRRRLLKRRIAQILQETTMSTRQLIASFTVGGAALALAVLGAVRSFPLEARTTQESTGAPVQIVKGGEHLLHASMPEYPRRAIEQRIEGEVLLDLTLDERGEVSDARVLSGPEELRRAALESALQWHYSPAHLRSTTTLATMRFRVPAEASVEFDGRRYKAELRIAETAVRKAETAAGGEADQEKAELSPPQRVERLMMELEEARSDPRATAEQREEYERKYTEAKERLTEIRARRWGESVRGQAETKPGGVFEGPSRLVQIKTERLPREMAAEIVAQAGIRVGDPITEEVAKRIREAAYRVDEHFRVSFNGDRKGGIVLVIIAP